MMSFSGLSGLLLLLMLTGVTVGELQKRVVNGRECKKKEGLHHVILAVEKDKKYYPVCGGSLIGDKWVLTAAHCIDEGLKALTYPTLDVSDIIEPHPYVENKQQHDIALLKLKDSFPHHNKVKLPNIKCKTPSISTDVTFHGFFTVDNPSPTATKGPSRLHKNQKLHCGDLKVQTCNDMSKYKNDKNGLRSIAFSWLLCAKDPAKEVDSCGGNSGGSLTTSDGVLSGVLSGSSKYFCGGPIIFTDVCRYRKWINQLTKL